MVVFCDVFFFMRKGVKLIVICTCVVLGDAACASLWTVGNIVVDKIPENHVNYAAQHNGRRKSIEYILLCLAQCLRGEQ